MGFEIKNICTLVPNPYRPTPDHKYYYISLFITPRLQFDGTLKEFYEMLNWPKYLSVFNKENVFCQFNNDKDLIPLELDDYYYQKLPGANKNTVESTREKLWSKLCKENTPVEAWPIYIKPNPELVQRDALIKALTVAIPKQAERVRVLTDKVKSITQTDSLTNQNIISELKLKQQQTLVAPGINVSINFDSTSSESSKLAAAKSELENAESKLKSSSEAKEILQKKKRDEIIQRTKLNEEFHMKLSAISRYPHILRLLGFIHDFKIEKSLLMNKIGINESSEINRLKFVFLLKNFKTNDEANFPAEEFKNSVQFICPNTGIQITPLTMGDSRLFSLQIDTYKQIVENGFIKRQFKLANIPEAQNRIIVDQAYYEDNMAKSSNQAIIDPKSENKNENSSLINKVFSLDDLAILNEVQNGSQISKGFSIRINDLVEDKPDGENILIDFVTGQQSITDESITKGITVFKAHHLDCGYRVDVSEVENQNEQVISSSIEKQKQFSQWYSLCKRHADYYIDEYPIEETDTTSIFHSIKQSKVIEGFENGFQDEPWLEEIRQITEDGKLARFEEISRWDNWSLTCPPYNAVLPKNDTFGDLELKNIKPTDLPKLRFGRKYKFRIRIVDICGNSPQLDDKQFETIDTKEAKYSILTEIYKRNEPISSPLLFPDNELYKLENSENPSDPPIIVGLDEDHLGEDNETLVIRTMINDDGSFESFNNACIRFLTPAQITSHLLEVSGTLDSYWFNTSQNLLYNFMKSQPKLFYGQKEMDTIPFIYDPEVIKICIQRKGACVYIPFELESEKTSYVDRKPIKLGLYSGPKTNVHPENEFYFQPGEEEEIIIRAVSKEDSNTRLELAKDTKMPIESTDKRVRLIHAVQKPSFTTEVENKNFYKSLKTSSFKAERVLPVLNSKKASTFVKIELCDPNKLNDIFPFPFSTTGEFIIIAEYEEYKLDSTASEGYSIITDNEGKNLKIVTKKSFSNFQEKDVNSLIPLLKVKDDSKYSFFLEQNQYFIHSLNDTKFRKVKYTLEAVSRFAHYFSIESLNKRHSWFDRLVNKPKISFSVQLEFNGLTYVENSVKPSKPEITEFIPLFSSIPNREKGVYNFKHIGFRVYLGPKWYETGLEEKIAVIHGRTIRTIHDISPIAKGKSSFLANDPIEKNNSFNASNDSTTLFINTTKDTLNINILEKNQYENPPGLGTNSNYVSSIFDVHWEPNFDKKTGQFYSDIHLNPEVFQHYSSLLKLTICRYQKYSINSAPNYDFRFSDAVTLNMSSLLPPKKVEFDLENRIVTLNTRVGKIFHGKSSTDRVDVDGYAINRVFLICTKLKSENENVTQISIGDFEMMRVIELNRPNGDTGNYSIPPIPNLTEFEEIIIEEYQFFKLNEDFKYNEIDKKRYNPRNDPRLKLIFFYKIK